MKNLFYICLFVVFVILAGKLEAATLQCDRSLFIDLKSILSEVKGDGCHYMEVTDQGNGVCSMVARKKPNCSAPPQTCPTPKPITLTTDLNNTNQEGEPITVKTVKHVITQPTPFFYRITASQIDSNGNEGPILKLVEEIEQ